MNAISLSARFEKSVFTFLTSQSENSVTEFYPLGSSCYIQDNPVQGYVISLDIGVHGQPNTTVMLSFANSVTTEQHHLSEPFGGHLTSGVHSFFITPLISVSSASSHPLESVAFSIWFRDVGWVIKPKGPLLAGEMSYETPVL